VVGTADVGGGGGSGGGVTIEFDFNIAIKALYCNKGGLDCLVVVDDDEDEEVDKVPVVFVEDGDIDLLFLDSIICAKNVTDFLTRKSL